MNTGEIVIIALGLAMDSLAVSIAAGVILEKFRVRQAARIAFFMGFFQAFMPLVGWMLGISFRNYIKEYDHWVAFIILSFLGGKMVLEGIRSNQEDDHSFDPTRLLTLFSLAIATSIDALAIGVSFAFLNIEIALPLVIIGMVTFVLSLFGVLFGCRLGCKVDLKIELIGGIILISIGTKILIEHLFFLA